jgi:spectinomycin phosphotransferase
MLEKADIPDELLVTCLQAEYSLRGARIEFLPLGADQNTAVYRAVVGDNAAYFVKLRHGTFNEISVRLPKYLSDQNLQQVIAPLETASGQLWADLPGYKLILYPYIEGRDGYAVELSDRHWVELGQAIRQLHTTSLPAEIAKNIQHEAYSPRERDQVKNLTDQVEGDDISDPISAKLTAFLQARRGEILDLIDRAERSAKMLRANPPDCVLCHSDLHAGNILIDGEGALYIVDWDDPIYAPKERDLMFPGGGQGFRGHTSGEEEAFFYQGYGPAMIDQNALAYYRYERIIQDIAAFCDHILLSGKGSADREQSFRYLSASFLPGKALDIARRSDRQFTTGPSGSD